MPYSFLADVIVAIHVLFVSYVLFGELVILAGWACHWRWVRNFWFRITHLAGISIVAVETVFGIQCPLTVWENQLRALAGQTVEQGTFIGRCLHHVMFFNGQPWVFNLCYLLFMVLVAVTFIFVPPLRRRSTESLTTPGPQPVS